MRQAMNYAINKHLILDKMLRGKGTVLKGQLLTSNTFGHNPKLQAYPYDPTKAKQLLAEAGFSDGFETWPPAPEAIQPKDNLDFKLVA